MERKGKKHPILMILAVVLVFAAAVVFAYFALRAERTPKVPICEDNAIYTFEILEKQDIRYMTIVTSSDHQRRSQMFYSLLAELYRQQHGYSAALVGNYNYEIDGSSIYALDDRLAVQGIAGILDLPKEVVRSMPPLNISGTSAGNGEDRTFGDAA